ncbi:coniferyl aldehyde dehydrogenase [uncultured Algimonas sp.]|uniref:coniferyl aldehyde dehydrogenase n=1 Tax=uncultured Algimonas sp. TaxID=1547920 RepID=UPI00263A23E4|nr:coniferyl aldehyde dehydrogenase [uncultured Algimonas sp.]
MVRINPEKPQIDSDLTKDDLQAALTVQKDAFLRNPYPAWSERKVRLEKLRDVIRAHEDDIKRTISEDFGSRSLIETDFADIVSSYNEIADYLKNGEKWMARRKVSIELAQKPGKGEIIPQPLGVVGIIVPWNYPLFLAVSPMIGAIAAGNSVMVKMSEYTPKFSNLFKRIMAEAFTPEEVFVATGGVEVAQAFSGLGFDHLLFTGSTSVGRHIMRAAAENLVPVTLELGGKSPVLVQDDAEIEEIVPRIALGKLMNAGQTCIAPDYALMPQAKINAFSEAMIRQAETMYPAFAGNDDYTTIIADAHYARLQDLLDDAEAKGATVRTAGDDDKQQLAQERRIPLTVVTGVNPDMKIMQEEIFGPLLPVVASDTLDDQIDYVQRHARPLALYLFTKDDAKTDRVLLETHAGGVTTNDTMWHISQKELPFGGVGPSGMGAYHGKKGFETFSHMKSVFHQQTDGFLARLKARMMAPIMAPHDGKSEKLVVRAKRFAGVR